MGRSGWTHARLAQPSSGIQCCNRGGIQPNLATIYNVCITSCAQLYNENKGVLDQLVRFSSPHSLPGPRSSRQGLRCHTSMHVQRPGPFWESWTHPVGPLEVSRGGRRLNAHRQRDLVPTGWHSIPRRSQDTVRRKPLCPVLCWPTGCRDNQLKYFIDFISETTPVANGATISNSPRCPFVSFGFPNAQPSAIGIRNRRLQTRLGYLAIYVLSVCTSFTLTIHQDEYNDYWLRMNGDCDMSEHDLLSQWQADVAPYR